MEGIKAAKDGVYKGRRPSIKPEREEGLGATEIAKRLGIGRASVYRVSGAARYV
jgi:DNA invertase Pin-like site-specific DNA recombinase